MGTTSSKNVAHKRNATEVVNIDDVLEALKEVNSYDNSEFEGCVSTEDIVNAMDTIKNRCDARAFVKKCMINELCEFVGKKQSVGIDGRTTWIPMYRFKKTNRKKK